MAEGFSGLWLPPSPPSLERFLDTQRKPLARRWSERLWPLEQNRELRTAEMLAEDI